MSIQTLLCITWVLLTGGLIAANSLHARTGPPSPLLVNKMTRRPVAGGRGYGVLDRLPAGAQLSDDALRHFEQLLELAGIRVQETGGQPDGTTCHRMERPLIIRRCLLDRLFVLVLQDTESLEHVVAPQVADASPGELVAVLWFDHQWNDYSCERVQ